MTSFEETLKVLKDRSEQDRIPSLIQFSGNNAEETLKCVNSLATLMSDEDNIIEVDMTSEERIYEAGVDPIFGLVLAVNSANLGNPTTVIFNMDGRKPDDYFQSELLYFLANSSIADTKLDLNAENLKDLLIIIAKDDIVNLSDSIDRRSLICSTRVQEDINEESVKTQHTKRLL